MLVAFVASGPGSSKVMRLRLKENSNKVIDAVRKARGSVSGISSGKMALALDKSEEIPMLISSPRAAF